MTSFDHRYPARMGAQTQPEEMTMLEKAHVGGRILTAVIALLFMLVFSLPSVTQVAGQKWSADEQRAINTAAIANLDEQQKAIVTKLAEQDHEITALKIQLENAMFLAKGLGGLLFLMTSFTALTGLKLTTRRQP